MKWKQKIWRETTHLSTNLIRSACNEVSELECYLFFLANPKLNRNWQHEMAKHVPEIKSEWHIFFSYSPKEKK